MKDGLDTQVTRREFLRNSVALSAIGALLWKAPRLFSAASLATNTTYPYLLVIHCDGGWDTTMTLEDKTSNWSYAQEPGSISAQGKANIPFVDNPARPSVKTFFDTYGDGTLIINGLYSKTITHEEGLLFSSSSFLQNENRYVDWLTYYASQITPSKEVPHLVIGAPYLPGPYAHYAYKMPADWLSTPPIPVLSGENALTDGEETALTSYLIRSYQGAVNTAQETTDLHKLQALLSGFTQSPALQKELTSFSLGTDTPWVAQGKFAIQCFKEGISQCATIQAGRKGLWDTHRDHYVSQSVSWEMLFAGLLSLVETITQAGLQNQVLLLVKSEIGRYPLLNANAGKDHWPYTSALLWGQPIVGGTVLGSTNTDGIAQPIDPLFGVYASSNLVTLTLENVLAGIFTRYAISQADYMDTIQPAMSQIRQPT